MSNKSKKSKMLNSTSPHGLAQKTIKEKLGLVALEPRILLDAAGFVTGAEVAMDSLISEDTQTGVEAIFNPDSLETFETYDTSDQLIRALEADTGSEANEYVIPMHNPEEVELSDYIIPMSEIEDLVVSEIEGRNFITSETGVDYLIPVSDRNFGEPFRY